MQFHACSNTLEQVFEQTFSNNLLQTIPERYFQQPRLWRLGSKDRRGGVLMLSFNYKIFFQTNTQNDIRIFLILLTFQNNRQT